MSRANRAISWAIMVLGGVLLAANTASASFAEDIPAATADALGMPESIAKLLLGAGFTFAVFIGGAYARLKTPAIFGVLVLATTIMVALTWIPFFILVLYAILAAWLFGHDMKKAIAG